MRIRAILCIFGLLFLASCLEVTISGFSPCQRMILSDALPVQFWLSDCDTYNETVPKGVHEACFCQPWQCDDEIKIQFQDDSSPEPDFVLLVQGDNDQYLIDLPFNEISSGIYEVSFIPSNYGICNKQVNLQICEAVTEHLLLPPDEWSSIFGTGFVSPIGSTDDTTFYIAHGSAGTASKSAYQPLPVSNGQTITFDFDLTLVTGDITVDFALLDSSDVTVSNSDQAIASTPGTTQHTVTLTATGDAAKLWISVSITGTPFEASIELLDVGASVVPTEIGTVFAKSDCLQIATVQDETELIEYSNERNFAGLIYQDTSPEQSFSIRVPCRFFHEQFPQEDEAIELTSQVVTTSSQIKSQKMLEVKHAPYYFHKKLQLVLMHPTLEIGGVAYKKEEKYEINVGNKKWPLKSATCLLTEKSSVIRNIL